MAKADETSVVNPKLVRTRTVYIHELYDFLYSYVSTVILVIFPEQTDDVTKKEKKLDDR